MKQAVTQVVIDTLRMVAAILSLPAILFGVVLGIVAFSDSRGRGCFAEEAMQCSDARDTVVVAIVAVVAGPLVFLVLTILRNVCARREGATNA